MSLNLSMARIFYDGKSEADRGGKLLEKLILLYLRINFKIYLNGNKECKERQGSAYDDEYRTLKL